MWGEVNMQEGTAGLALRRKKDSIWPGGFPEDDNLGLRVHRAISWIGRAEQESDDSDAAFVFYWIAFNSAYAKDIQDSQDIGERTRFVEYFQMLVNLDADRKIYDAVWSTFAGPIRVLLDNQYVFQPFWNHVNGLPGYDGWESSFEMNKSGARRALAASDTGTVLSILFDRLYVLRNQIIHGGATWNSSVNRDQVRDGTRILESLVPLFIDVMMDNRRHDWGPPYYPMVS